jgi:hypothetical protein
MFVGLSPEVPGSPALNIDISRMSVTMQILFFLIYQYSLLFISFLKFLKNLLGF